MQKTAIDQKAGKRSTSLYFWLPVQLHSIESTVRQGTDTVWVYNRDKIEF